jgi:excisionase family DNA binding protein
VSRLLTPEDVAEMLGVSRRTVQRMAADGELPALRIGAQWRFRAESITDWQAARETGNPPQQRQTSAPAAAPVARPAALPVGGVWDLPADNDPTHRR